MRNKVSIRKERSESDAPFQHIDPAAFSEYVVRVDDIEVSRIRYRQSAWVWESLADSKDFQSLAEAKAWARKKANA